MVTRNHRIRFGNNNWLEGKSYIDFSPSSSQFGTIPSVRDLQEPTRTLSWIPTGNFTITSENSLMYVDEGSGEVTVTLTEGNYLTGDSLATEIQSKLNAALTHTWVCTFSINSFTITSDQVDSIILSNQVNAVWDTIGFTGGADVSNTTWSSTSPRIHTSEYFDVDLGTALDVTLLALLGESAKPMGLTSSAVIRLQGNNINDFTSPDYSVDIEPDTRGIYKFIDDTENTEYRYWRIEIIDRKNPRGNEGLGLSYIYLGDYLTMESRNLNNGFNRTHKSNTRRERSEGGQLFHNIKPSYTEISNVGLSFLEPSDIKNLEQFIYDVDVHTPFILSLDPTLMCSTDLVDLTWLVVLESEMQISHVRGGYYSINMKFRELL